MKILPMRVFIFVISCLIASTAVAEKPWNYTDLPLDKAIELAKSDGKNIWVYFGFESRCSACKYIESNVTANNEVGNAYHNNFHFVYAQSWPRTEKAEIIRTQYSMPSGSPHFLFLDRNGKEICRNVGGFNSTRIDALPIAMAGKLSVEEAVIRAKSRGLRTDVRNCYSIMKD